MTPPLGLVAKKEEEIKPLSDKESDRVVDQE